MTNAQRTWHVAGPRISISPTVGIGLVAAVLAIGAIAVARQSATQQSTTPAVVAPFDAVKFRAEEHAAIPPRAQFDAVKFRAEEHAAIVQPPAYQPTYWRPYDSSSNPTLDIMRYLSERGLLSNSSGQVPFDAVAFRAEEHAAMTPLAPYNDTLYNAQRRARTDGPPTSSGGGRGIQAK
jgi:hypothetical protein